MTREQIATALEAAAYFYRAGRAYPHIIDTIYAVADEPEPTVMQLDAVSVLLEDWAEVQAGRLS